MGKADEECLNPTANTVGGNKTVMQHLTQEQHFVY